MSIKQKNIFRQAAFYDYLINKGINKERLKYIGYGKSKPITGNDSEEDRSKNRRVEFVLVKK